MDLNFRHGEVVQNYSGKGGRLIITGLLGSGKATLSLHLRLAQEWANGRIFNLPFCQILFLLYSHFVHLNAVGDLLSKSGFGDLMMSSSGMDTSLSM